MISITYTIEITWLVRGYDNYGFGTDKELYNLKTNRRLKQSYNSGSIGYWFSKKFITTTRLRGLLYKPKYDKCPF